VAVNTKDVRNALQQRAQDGAGRGNSLNALMGTANVKKRFEELLGDRAAGFMSSLLNVVNGSTQLRQCNPNQILATAAIAAAMNLPIDPNLGFAYIVPYKGKAQFQMGYRGYIQLAMRTGQYKTISATEVYEGEIDSYNRITGEIEVNPDGRKSDAVVGYIAYFRLLNGFEKYDYMTVAEVQAHAKRFSQSYGKGSASPWTTDFDSMATKTVLKRLLSRYGILSIEMQTAVRADQAAVTETSDGEPEFDYVDSTAEDASGADMVPDEVPGYEQEDLV